MTLAHEMERVGRIVAADQGLEVTLRGVEAFSVPGRVNLPNIESLSWLGREARRMLHGLLDHETAHALWSDHKVVGACRGDKECLSYVSIKYRSYFDAKRMRKLREDACEALALMCNSVEDAWIERLQGERYPGAATNLHKKNRWFFEKDDTRKLLGSEDRWGAYMMAVTLIGRGSVSFAEFEPWPEVHKMLMQSRDLIDSVQFCADSGRALDLAYQMFDRFERPPPPPAPPSASEDEDDESDDDSEPEGGEDGDADDVEGSDDGSSDGDDSEGDSDGDGDEDDSDDDSDGDDEEGPEDDAGEPESGSGSEDGSEDDSEGEGAEGSSGDGQAGTGDVEGEGKGDDDGEDGDDRPPVEGIVPMDLKRYTTEGGGALNPEDKIAREIRSVFEQPTRVQPYTVFSHEWDFERDLSSCAPPDATRWRRLLDESAEVADVLTQTFEVALKAKREKRPISGADYGEVDTEAMIEYSVGARLPDTIYTQWAAEDDTDVAVSVLVDCSGSMGKFARRGSKAYLAALTATAMHRALSAVQIAHEITGFTCIDSRNGARHPWVTAPESQVAQVSAAFREMRAALVDAEKRGTRVTRFARALYAWDSDDPRSATLVVPAHAIFKSFGSQDGRGLCWIDGIHENLDGEAVMWQARRLAQRPEPRRVMFVLSDGLPAGSRDNAQGRRYLKETVERITDAGIEVYGIGIQSAHVTQFYPRAWVADTPEELCSIAMEGMIEVIAEARQEQRWVNVA